MPRRKRFRLTRKKTHSKPKENDEEREKRQRLEFLDDVYFKATSPVAYSTFPVLYKYLKTNKPGQYSRKFVKDWLNSKDEYTLHRQRKRPKHFAHIYVHKPGHSIDLDVGFFKLGNLDINNSEKKSVKFQPPEKMLIGVDLFSKFLTAEPLRDLKSESIIKAMNKILIKFPNLKVARHDLGQEFRSKQFLKLLSDKDIKSIKAYPPRKASNAERVLRSFKSILMKLMQHKGQNDFSKVLKDALEIYNHRGHTSLDMLSPTQAMDEKNIGKIKQFILNKHVRLMGPPVESFEFRIGSPVRIEVDKGPFSKEHTPRYSTEIYFVDTRKRRDNVNYYHLKTVSGEIVEGAFHERELVPTNISQLNARYKVELVHPEERRIGNTIYKAVTFQDFPGERYWIPEKDIFDLT